MDLHVLFDRWLFDSISNWKQSPRRQKEVQRDFWEKLIIFWIFEIQKIQNIQNIFVLAKFFEYFEILKFKIF